MIYQAFTCVITGMDISCDLKRNISPHLPRVVQANPAASKHLFSVTGLVLPDKRNKLSDNNTENATFIVSTTCFGSFGRLLNTACVCFSITGYQLELDI